MMNPKKFNPLKGIRGRDRVVSRSVQVGLGADRPSSGFGHIIIPSDIDRLDYMNHVYRTGTCMIATSFNDIYKGVRIPKHMIDDIEFPKDYSSYGQLVSWVNTPTINQVTLFGFIIPPDEVYSGNEHTKGRFTELDGRSFAQSTNVNENTSTHIIKLESTVDEEGFISISCSGIDGKSEVRVGLDGTVTVSSDVGTVISSFENIQLITGTEDDENQSRLLMSTEGIFEFTDFNDNIIRVEEGKVMVDSLDGEIHLGEQAEEPAVLGDALEGLLGELIDAINTMTVSTSAGPSSVPINASVFSAIKARLVEFKSGKSKIE